MQLVKIDFVARAPEGHEVEELTRKQMIKSLQNKRPVSELRDIKSGFTEGKRYNGKEEALQKYLKKVKIKDDSIIMEAINTIQTGHSIGFNKSLDRLFDIPVGDIFEKIRDFKDTQFLIIDGILTKRLLSLSINMKIKFIACKNKEEEVLIPEHLVVSIFNLLFYAQFIDDPRQ